MTLPCVVSYLYFFTDVKKQVLQVGVPVRNHIIRVEDPCDRSICIGLVSESQDGRVLPDQLARFKRSPLLSD